MTPPSASRPAHLPALDGLRAVAVAAVVAFHLGHLDGGFLGVDVFFTLSGFLITRLLLAERARTGRISLRAFWARRVRRLLPALLLVLVAVAAASWAWLPRWRLPALRDDALSALAYVANWRFVASGQSYFAGGIDPSPLRHTWSLAVEEQFYVLWPLLVVVAIRVVPLPRRVAVAALSVVVGGASAAWMVGAAQGGADLTRVYYGTDTRVFALLAGAAVATWWDPLRTVLARRPASRAPAVLATAGSGALAALLVLFVVGREDEVGFYRGSFQLTAVLAAAAVAGIGLGRGRVAALLSTAPAQWVGRRSYGIYLWSWPVQVLARARLPQWSGWRLDLATVVVAVGAAAASYRFVERPVLEGRPVLPRRARSGPAGARPTRLRPVAAVGAVAVVVAVVVGAAAGAPDAPRYLTVSDDEVRAAALADDGFSTPAPEPPVTGAGTPSTTTTTTTAAAAAGPEAARVGSVPAADVIDPGPAPPFDPAAPPLSTVQAAPDRVHGRPLRVVIIGDSVGWSLGWEVQDRVRAPVDISNRAMIGCGVMPADSSWVGAHRGVTPYPAGCADQAEAEDLAFSSSPDVVLLWLGAWEVFDHVVDGRRLAVGSAAYAEVLEARIQQRIDRARSIGVPTVVPLVPCFDPALSQDYRAERLDAARVLWVNHRIRAVAARNPGWVRLVDPTPVLCDEAGRSRRINPEGLVLRDDGAHFDEEPATWVWDAWLAGSVAGAFTVPG